MKAGAVFRLLAAIFVVTALGAIGGLACAIGAEEAFTEFYVLGPDGRAEGYPAEFIIQEGRVVLVKYGDDRDDEVAGGSGTVILEVVNREREETTYLLTITIDGRPVTVGGAASGEVELMTLAHEEVWRREIGLVPQHIGDGQRVDFALLKDGAAYLELYILIDVRNAG